MTIRPLTAQQWKEIELTINNTLDNIKIGATFDLCGDRNEAIYAIKQALKKRSTKQ